MKHVVDSDMVAHLWANKSQSDARNSGGNFYFDGLTIYSYGSHFPIARHIKNKHGEWAVLFTTKSYSVTTTKHLSMTRRALRGGAIVFNVPDVGSESHKDRLRDYQGRITASAEKASRARSNAEWLINQTEKLAKEANTYAAFFGLKWRTKTTFSPEFLAECKVKAARASKLEADKRRKADIARQAQEAEARALYIGRLEEWVAGIRDQVPYGWNHDVPVRLRLRDDVVQTSRGAEVPVDHARRLWPIIQRVRTTQVAYKSNGHTEHVGHFTVDTIDTDGTLTAGCHIITYAELERMARILRCEVA